MGERRSDVKYGCSSASSAVILRSGSYANRDIRRSNPAAVRYGNLDLNWCGCGEGRVKVAANGRVEYSGQEFLVGGPSNLNIIEMSSNSPCAWNSGSLRMSSAKIQPTDHMSIAVE